MPNKTVYVRDSDLSLWKAAQAEPGESISALFAEFLRERLPKMDAFVHVLRCSPGSGSDGEFVVMIAPAESSGPMKPNYVSGIEQVSNFLLAIDMPAGDIAKIEKELQRDSSATSRSILPRSVPTTDFYRLRFRSTRKDASGQETIEIDAIGIPVSGSKNQWRARFHSVNDLISALENKLGLPAAQLAAVRRSVLSVQETELGGVTGAPYVIAKERLVELGMVEIAS
jgi:hypothetical protein